MRLFRTERSQKAVHEQMRINGEPNRGAKKRSPILKLMEGRQNNTCKNRTYNNLLQSRPFGHSTLVLVNSFNIKIRELELTNFKSIAAIINKSKLI